MAMNLAPHVLIIGGSDSSGGAGIIRDVETVAAFGLKSCVAITAVTAQTHDRAISVETVDATLVATQVRTAFQANTVAAIKIGMLANAEIVSQVANVLAEHPDIPVVVDPVLASSSCKQLLDDEGTTILLEKLLPLSALITPNLPELAALTGFPTIDRAANRLLEMGARAVLVKGGHASGHNSTDTLFTPHNPPITFSAKRQPHEMRGTGCTLASAIAAGLAGDQSLESAIERAKAYLCEIMHQAADPCRTAKKS